MTSTHFRRAQAFGFVALSMAGCPTQATDEPWKMHVIDDTSAGADGAKLFDVNGDGWLDLTVPWEMGSEVRVYLHPGPDGVDDPWPRVRVGAVAGPEDAVFADLDGDGFADVVSSTEGTDVPGGNGIFVHWAPASTQEYLEESQWTTGRIPATEGQNWIHAAVFQVDGKGGPDIIAGTHTGTARVVLLTSPKDSRELERWGYHEIHRGGRKVMSLIPHDFDGDGDQDVFLTQAVEGDAEPGVGWLENPGSGARNTNRWKLRPIGAPGDGASFGALGDLDQDGRIDVVARTGERLLWFRRLDPKGLEWEAHEVDLPRGGGSGKAVSIADIDGDGANDIVLARTWNPPAVMLSDLVGCERSGIVWLSYRDSPTEKSWKLHDISGPRGSKFDLVPVLDLDGDGDLDVITTEEKESKRGLGVIWYENPRL